MIARLQPDAAQQEIGGDDLHRLPLQHLDADALLAGHWHPERHVRPVSLEALASRAADERQPQVQSRAEGTEVGDSPRDGPGLTGHLKRNSHWHLLLNGSRHYEARFDPPLGRSPLRSDGRRGCQWLGSPGNGLCQQNRRARQSSNARKALITHGGRSLDRCGRIILR